MTSSCLTPSINAIIHEIIAICFEHLYPAGGPDLKKDGKTGNVPIVNHNSAFLGPNLWEKNNSNGSNFDLEYMDLDEFLSENGIPINLEDDEDAHQVLSHEL